MKTLTQPACKPARLRTFVLLGLFALAPVTVASPEGAEPSPAPEAEPSEAAAHEPESPLPAVTEAFGLTLGTPFEPCMVAEVLGEQAREYRAPDEATHQGMRYQVTPRTTNPHFDHYSVSTNEHGVIYAIEASFESPEKASTCDVTQKVAGLLEEKYGPPRGKGRLGEWYAFRDLSVPHYRGIRLYANRCKQGIHSIQYSDDGAKLMVPEPPPEPTEASGL